MAKNKGLKMYKVLGIVLGICFIASCMGVAPGKILAGGEDKEITGNRGYLVGGPSAGEEVKKKTKVKRQRGKLEIIEQKVTEFGKHIETYNEKRKRIDKVVPAKKGGVAPKGYLVGTPKDEPVEMGKERGAGGFADGWDKAIANLKEFNRKIKKPYPADQSLEGTKGGYLYGEPPAEGPEPEREIARTRGLKPFEFISVLGKGVENLHSSWNTKPHRSTDKEIWGFAYPDMPKKEKKGITRHRGNPIKGIGSLIDTVGADIDKHKATAPVDK